MSPDVWQVIKGGFIGLALLMALTGIIVGLDYNSKITNDKQVAVNKECVDHGFRGYDDKREECLK